MVFSLDRTSTLRWAGVILLAAMLTLAGCRGREMALRPTPGAAASGAVTNLPEVASEDVVAPERGGLITLDDGAQLALPPGALSEAAKTSFNVSNVAPVVPIPRSLLGRAYDFSLDGGDLTGVALLKLPLPTDVSSPQYDVAPYRWNGKTWERINGRTTEDGIQFGASRPGTYAVLGQWSLADGLLALVRPETPPGQQTIPLAVTGQYRYSVLPALQDGYVKARLTLKQDTSGGAGRVTGDAALDKTVDEAQLLFQPDPAQAQGVIEFSHIFQLAPGALTLALGDTTRFYTLLTVDDSAAPTRRLSSGVEYTQVLPIQAVGRAIVRPKLAAEGEQELRWHVRRDGQTYAFERAVTTELPFEPILAEGGLGEYRFTLETQKDDAWVAVSNDVTVKLTVPATATPPESVVSAPDGTQAVIATPTPEGGGPVPDGTPPQVPTRRPIPGGAGVAEPSATPTAAAVAALPTGTPTRPAWATEFWADRYALKSGECTILHWDVQNVNAVYFNGSPAEGKATREVCPVQTTTYTLRSTSSTGTQDRTVTIVVGAGTDAGVEFTTDTNQVVLSQCATLRWRAVNVRAVYLYTQGVPQGVPGESSQQVCPQVDTTYELRVENMDGTTTTKAQTIKVVSADKPVVRFWAEQYSLPANACTMLNWNVQNVREVFLDDRGVSGQGSTQFCPSATQVITLRVTTNSGQSVERAITLSVNPQLEPTEVIARGIVQQVISAPDTDSTQPGDQIGYQLTVDGINTPLFAGTPGWGQAVVSLLLPQTDTAASANLDAQVDWPITPGQQVEFRAFCEGANCYVRTGRGSYLHLRSQ